MSIVTIFSGSHCRADEVAEGVARELGYPLIAGQLVEARVATILNFAPVALKLPPGVTVRNVDFVQELAVLSFHLPDAG